VARHQANKRLARERRCGAIGAASVEFIQIALGEGTVSTTTASGLAEASREVLWTALKLGLTSFGGPTAHLAAIAEEADVI